MKKNLLLEDQIARIKTLSGIDEAAGPGPTQWIADLIAKIQTKTLSDAVVNELDSALASTGKIGIDKTRKVITFIDWNKLTDDEVKLIFRSDEMVSVFQDVIIKNNISLDDAAVALYTPRFKKIVNGYIDGKAAPRITGNSTNTNTGNLNLGNLSSNFVDRSDFMQYVEANPKFSAVLKVKGNKDQLQKWIELNLPERLEKSQIIENIRPYIQDLIDSPDPVRAGFGKKVDGLLDFMSKGNKLGPAMKGGFYWTLFGCVILVGLGIITPWDALKFYLCPFLTNDKLRNFAGCSGGSGSSSSSNNSGGLGKDDY